MAYTVTQLITDAYYLSGIVAQDSGQQVTAAQITNGLTRLNGVLALRTADANSIPYYSSYAFNEVVSQEKYFIPNLIQAETFTFYIGPTRYSVAPQSRKVFHGSFRVVNIQSLTFQWSYERCLGGSDLYLYPLPDQAYDARLWGKFSLSSVELGQDLTLTLDQYYIQYLLFASAKYLCSFNNQQFPAAQEEQLREIAAAIFTISPPDLTIQKATFAPGYGGINLGDVNIGHGARPW